MVVLRCRVFIEFLGRKGSEGSLSSIPFLQRKKLRLREGKELTAGHSARQGQVPGSQPSKPCHCIPRAGALDPNNQPRSSLGKGTGWGRRGLQSISFQSVIVLINQLN